MEHTVDKKKILNARVILLSFFCLGVVLISALNLWKHLDSGMIEPIIRIP